MVYSYRMRKAEEHGDGWQGTAYPGERALTGPTPDVPTDRLFAIHWHARQARRSRAGVAALMRRWLGVSAGLERMSA
jgi:hypothetical protein